MSYSLTNATPKRCGIRSDTKKKKAARTCPATKYDYVVVGGGASGCALASRLSEVEGTDVLLLEAGGRHDSLLLRAPLGITRLFRNVGLDWMLHARKEESVFQREVYFARGKVLGGSSATNATLYHRGAAADYEAWGVEGWKAEDVLPWFCKAEDNERGPGRGRGVGGMMHVEDPRYDNPLFQKFFDAAESVGLKPNPDFNDWETSQEGYGAFQVTQKKGERWDAYKAYLEPALGRENLQVMTDAHATKVHFEGKRAVGVEFSIGGRGMATNHAELKEGGEVILAAGAVHSPHLLMLSGVGPDRELSKHGIKPVRVLEGVGQNMQDHPACLTAYTGNKPISITDEVYNAKGNIRKRAILKYLLFKRGPLATTACDRGAFVRSKAATSSLPDLQLRFPPGLALDADGVSSYVKFGKLKEEGTQWPSGITFQTIACRPKSKGSISLSSDNSFDAPQINHGFLTDPDGADLASLIEGIKITREMAKSAAFKDFLVDEIHPGEDVGGDRALEEYVRKTVHSANAIVGTCRLGKDPLRGAVVGPDLKVHGVDGLRVIDSSVIPVIPGAQTAAPTVMIAERAAALLRGQPIGLR